MSMATELLAARLLACLVAATSPKAPRQVNAFANAAFDMVDAKGIPAGITGWDGRCAKVAEEGGNRFMRITNEDPKAARNVQFAIPVEAGWKAVLVSARMGVQGFKRGKENWHDARLAFRFEKADGKMVGGYGDVPRLETDSPWVTLSVVRDVPTGAERIGFTPGLYFCPGRLDLDDLRVVPIDRAAHFAASARPITEGFPEGRFEQVRPDGSPVGWRRGNARLCTVSEADGSKVLRVANDEPDADTFVTGLFALGEDWAELELEARLRVENLRPGPSGWKQARINAEFLDAAGEHCGRGPDGGTSQSSDWTTIRNRLVVPTDARHVRLAIGLFRATGTMEVDDLLLTGHVAPPAADARLPEGEALDWTKADDEAPTECRGRICLNGWWRFCPAAGSGVRPPEKGWGYLRVPGSWSTSGWPPVPQAEVVKGAGPSWQVNLQKLPRAWYERRIRIPKSWAGRAVLLDLRRVSTDARVVVNGVDCGTVSWPTGKVDITRAVQCGAEAVVRILVVAVQNEKEVTVHMGPDQVHTAPARLNSRGLIGDVLLVSRPAGPHVSDVFVQTSTRRQHVDLAVEVRGVRHAGRVAFTARMLDEKGAEERRFAAEADVGAADVQTVRLRWPWPKPRLWDIGRPNLYTCVLRGKGAGLDDEVAEGFGFREFWIDGRRFLLNGTEIRLRPMVAQHAYTIEQMDGVLDDYRAAGFNALELWPWDHDQRGTYHHRELWCERADRKGIAMIAPALSMNRYVFDKSWAFTWDRPGVADQWERRMAAELRRWRNRPSILMWATSANFFGHALDQDPRHIGRRGWADDDEGWKRKAGAGMDGIARIKRHDPTRPVLTHQGAYVSDAHTINHYLCLLPLQDREEWLSDWARRGEMPYMAVEYGTPLHTTMMRGRIGFGDAVKTEPLMTEFCAVYLGRRAYELEQPVYRKRIAATYKGDQLYDHWIAREEINHAPAFQELQRLFSTNTWRSCRALGCTGGMIPWNQGHGWRRGPDYYKQIDVGPFRPGRRGAYSRKQRLGNVHPLKAGPQIVDLGGKALIANNGPTLAWIAGPPDVVTAKDHSFQAGQEVTKSVVLINDTRQTARFSWKLTVTVGGKTVADEEDEGSLPPAGTKVLPVRFRLPGNAEAKTDGEAFLVARIAGREHTDRFAFRVFPPPARLDLKGVAVFDPVGRTKTMLKRLGCEAKTWDGQRRAGLVVIGREALSKGHELPGDLEAHVAAGGRVILFTQHPDWLRKRLSLRIAHQLGRYVWPVRDRHPAVGGLDALDLRNWAGSSTLVEPYPYYRGDEFRKGAHGVPYWGWRWGARGAVTSAPVEKPHLSAWRPILECGFDLAYSPLMELDYGKGRLILCTLDLADHVPGDAAAMRLARSLLTYVATAPLSARARKAVYVGGEPGKKLLDSLGMLYVASDRVDGEADLLILGPQAKAGDPALEQYVRAGGRLLVLARSTASAPLGVTLRHEKAFGGSLDVPDWPEARGLSPSDLRRRTDGAAWLVPGGAEIGAGGQLARKRLGKGVAVFCQLGPASLDADAKTYLRYTRWRHTRAIAQVLANLGASFRADRRIFHPRDPDRDRVTLAGTWRVRRTSKLPASTGADKAPADPGISKAALALVGTNVDTSGWEKTAVPGMWEGYRQSDGEAVFRTVIDVPAELAGKALELRLGAVDDFDDTYFNGVCIGRTSASTPNFWAHPRVYAVPARLVKPGRNTLAVRVYDRFGGGGFAGPKLEMLLRLPPKKAPSGFYCPDWRDDFERGDDPYRYYRW